jgi:hypothetical protein
VLERVGQLLGTVLEVVGRLVSRPTADCSRGSSRDEWRGHASGVAAAAAKPAASAPAAAARPIGESRRRLGVWPAGRRRPRGTTASKPPRRWRYRPEVSATIGPGPLWLAARVAPEGMKQGWALWPLNCIPRRGRGVAPASETIEHYVIRSSMFHPDSTLKPFTPRAT